MQDRELERVRATCAAIIDPYIIVDEELGIVDFNSAFHALFPRQVARKLKRMRCCEALNLDICGDGCIALAALRRGANVRYDEISGAIAETAERLRLIGSATPLLDEHGKPWAALVIYRNVTDEAKIQSKYRSMLDEANRDREALLEDLAARTEELLRANATVNRLEESLMVFRKGLLEPCSLELPAERLPDPGAPRLGSVPSLLGQPPAVAPPEARPSEPAPPAAAPAAADDTAEEALVASADFELELDLDPDEPGVRRD